MRVSLIPGLLVGLLFASTLSAGPWNTRAADFPLPCAQALPSFDFQLSEVYRPDNAFLALWASYLAERDDARLIGDTLNAWGFTNIKLIGHASRGANAFLAEADDFNLLVFRGTKSFYEQAIDALFFTSPFASQGLAGWGHSGFRLQFAYLWNELEKVLPGIDKGKPWVVSGHSLGGALAMMHAVRLVSEGYALNALYTSGQPRVGDEVFYQDADTKLAGRYYRVENQMDYTSHIPPSKEAAPVFADVLFAEGSWEHGVLTGLAARMNYATPGGMKVVIAERLVESYGQDIEDDRAFWQQVRKDFQGMNKLSDLQDMIKAQNDRHIPETYICRFLEAYLNSNALGVL